MYMLKSWIINVNKSWILYPLPMQCLTMSNGVPVVLRIRCSVYDLYGEQFSDRPTTLQALVGLLTQ
jgi:hypothetical protein